MVRTCHVNNVLLSHGFHVREFGSEGARSIFQDAQSGTPPELMPQDEMSQYDQGWSFLNKWQIIVATIFQVFLGRMCRIPHINGWLEFAPSIILRAIAIQEAMKSGVNTFQQQKHYRQWRRLRTWKKPRQCCSPIVLTWRQTACNDGMKLSNGNWESMA